MTDWKEVSPTWYEIALGTLVLRVKRLRDVWYASCDRLCLSYGLKAQDAASAKAEALDSIGAVVGAWNKAIAEARAA